MAPSAQADIDVAASSSTATSTQPAYQLYSPLQRWLMLGVLFLIAAVRIVDSVILSVLLEPIKAEFKLSDTQLGVLSGFAFVFFYAVLGLPLARWADSGNRRTIIAACLAVWSVMTALCGVAQSYVQLLLARVGVGAGEAGSTAPSQSLIADYFPPDKRAGALAVFTAANTIGALFAFVVGAQLAQAHGWRTALVVVGLPGVLLALLAMLLLKEPRQSLGWPVLSTTHDGSLRVTLRSLFAKRSYTFIVVGIALYSFGANGIAVFFPSFMIRSLGVSMADVGIWYGSISAGAALVGTLGGGWLANRAGARDVRWLAWLPALCVLLAFPCYATAFLIGSFNGFLIFCFVASLLLGGSLPAAFAALHAVCGNSRRAMAVAVTYFALSLFGTGLGPLVTGALSDAFAASFGQHALAWALVTANLVMLPCAWALFMAGRTMSRDLEA